MDNKCAILDGLVYGEKVSDEGLKYSRLGYYCLSRILRNMGGCILNNEIIEHEPDAWNIYNGDIYDEEKDNYIDIFQYFIIDGEAAEWLLHHSDEIVFYNSFFDVYLWGITHYGTAWDYVLTDIELVPYEEYFASKQ